MIRLTSHLQHRIASCSRTAIRSLPPRWSSAGWGTPRQSARRACSVRAAKALAAAREPCNPFHDCSYRSWEKRAAERRGAALVALHPSRHTSLVARNRCIGKNLNTANILLRSRAWVRVPHLSYHRMRSHVFFQRQALHCHPTRQTHMVSGVSGDKSKTPEMVAKFYNLVTDFYE